MTPDTYRIANNKIVEQGTLVFHISGSAGTIGPGEYFRTGSGQILLENLDDYFATQKEAYQASLDREINKRSRIVTQHPAYDHQKVLLQKMNLLKGVEFIESQQVGTTYLKNIIENAKSIRERDRQNENA